MQWTQQAMSMEQKLSVRVDKLFKNVRVQQWKMKEWYDMYRT